MKENAYKPSDWLPTSVKEVRARGWDTLDVILFTGDAYVDHPSFGPAVVGRLLEAEGLDVRVIDMHTIKPIDRRLVLEAARETGAIVTSEEHNVLGGLGGAVAEVVGEEYPVPVLRHGMRDCFGKSGKHDDVLALFGLTETVLADTVRRAVALKK